MTSDDDIIKCETEEDKRLHKALRKALLEPCKICGEYSNESPCYNCLKERIKELKDALRKYGRHKPRCKTNFIDSSMDRTCNTFFKDCDCDFEQALKG